ncbi:hypothetical protein BD770DRAFT_447730 [Pilaira anomala]|nr:hypothetical protein BD770DRAFT_447730 [Pilaira anomala]
MSTQINSQRQPVASPEMREPFSDISNTAPPTPPPPAYQDDVNPVNTNRVGETYYQPPPVLYPPPPVPETLDTPTLGNLAIIIGLASGLTRNAFYYYSNCECRTNADCLKLYGNKSN